MNFEEIKEIVQKEGGKIIIVENDKPQMVIMSFDAWKGGKVRPAEQAPKPILAREEERTEGLTIDDLPL